MQRARVGKLHRYKGTYRSHWEADESIRISIVPSPWRVLARVATLLGIGLLYQAGWLDAGFALLLGFSFLVFAPKLIHERWLPKFAPGIVFEPEIDCAIPIEFEAIVGPRRRTYSPVVGPMAWDREVIVARILG